MINMKEKVTKKLETNVAELIMVGIFLAVMLSSCSSTNNYALCPAYASNETSSDWHETEGIHENLTQKEYNELIACENCDEID
tara:strand:- start:1191 stop:1439 length:249 start_codon:yes stop_codon:yes gene_type:complete